MSREKLDFLCDTIGWIACCVLYTDPILLFIFLRFIPERLGYIRLIENIFEKQLSPWRSLFVSKLYLQLPWALTWTQRGKKKKLDPIHLINLFYLSPVLFLLLSINQCARWAGKSRWKIVSRIDLKVQEDDGRCVEYKNWNKTKSDSFVKESQTEKPYFWMERTWQPQSSSIYSSDTHAGTVPSGIDVDVRKSMKLQAKVGRANRQQQRRKMESSGYSGSRGRTLIEGGTVYIYVCVCVCALYSSLWCFTVWCAQLIYMRVGVMRHHKPAFFKLRYF